MEEHNSKVKNIQEKIKGAYTNGWKVSLCHGSTNSTRSLENDGNVVADVSDFKQIISVNVPEKYIVVEPNVPMDALVEETLKHGLLPPVVPEFPGITVGGAIQGGAGESSSFKFGLVHDCALEYEIILGNGDLITASRESNQDIFWGTACSYGSLGIMTLIKLRLTPAKDFVHITYQKVGSFGEMVDALKNKTAGSADFVDGIMFSKDLGVVMSGNLSGKQNLSVSTFCGATDEWFYIHANKISKEHDKYEELIPIRDYLFRYDRGGFWAGRFIFNFLKIPYLKIFRRIFDRFLRTRSLFQLSQATNISQRYLVQDLSLPPDKVVDFLEFVDKETGIYPLWFCPLKTEMEAKLSPACNEKNMVINVGVWGEASHNYSEFLKLNRNLEKKVIELGGRKVLYAHAYYPREEFWKIYDYDWYVNIRKKYYAERSFSDLYEKVFVKEKYKPSVWGGIWKLAISKLKNFSKK